jgi:transposase
MARTASTLTLAEGDREKLEKISRTRTEQAQRVDRSRILLAKADGKGIDEIAAMYGVNRNTAAKCVRKYREGGLDAALADAPGRGRPASVGDADKAWVVDLACRRPADLGHAAEAWTVEALAAHVRANAATSGHPALAGASKSMVWRILDEAEVKPHRVRYYCERRDPEFDSKMHDVLVVYEQVSFRFDDGGDLIPRDDEGPGAHAVSAGEKPGIQAISPTGPGLRPAPGVQGGAVLRDYEYKRLGTVSLLAGIDLLDGHVTGIVRDRHRSREFVELLEALDARYPEGDVIRLVLDNRSIHRSKETKAWLAAHPGRFELVFTPTHGSWLNVIEGFFGKMSRQVLRGIRVASKQELVDRIGLYLDEVNADPVPHRWKWGIAAQGEGEGVA